jgi:hypothetical protein
MFTFTSKVVCNFYCYFIVVNFIGEGNRNTQRKPLTCLKTLINFITLWVMAMVINATFNNLCCMLDSIQLNVIKGQSWSWSYGSWIYNYLCNQYLSPLKLWVPLINFITLWVMAMVINATFNNLSDISWRSVLLVAETRVPKVY